jgi:hypothetical protein
MRPQRREARIWISCLTENDRTISKKKYDAVDSLQQGPSGRRTSEKDCARPKRKMNISNSENGWDKGLDVHNLILTGKSS